MLHIYSKSLRHAFQVLSVFTSNLMVLQATRSLVYLLRMASGNDRLRLLSRSLRSTVSTHPR